MARCSSSIPQNVLRRIQKYMPYRTGATIKLTIAQTDTHVPEIVTDNPQARYLYYGMSKSGKPLNYTQIKTRWPGRAGTEAAYGCRGRRHGGRPCSATSQEDAENDRP
ncbi:MAG: hypothetical protein ACLTZH_03285 [Subdoligranulum sp.]